MKRQARSSVSKFPPESETAKGDKIMATITMESRPPLPPFTRESAIQKVRLAEDGWNTRDPGKVALAYAIDSRWRNRSEFINRSEEHTSELQSLRHLVCR